MMKVLLKKPHQKQQTKSPKPSQTAGATFFDHVVELRRRGLWVGFVFLIFSALAYSYNDVLLKIIMAPLQGEKLVYLTPGGGFSFIFLVSIYAGLLVAIPVLIHHLHAFIKPALPERAKHSAAKIILAATLLIITGVAYGYFVAIPAALHFLTTFAGDAVIPNLTADSYLNFFLAYIAGLAVLSLLPLILMFVHWINPLKPSGLLKSERWVILFAFVAAALITPTPDIVNQGMIALPVIGIYQLGVLTVVMATLKEKRKKKVLLARQQQERQMPQLKATTTPREIPKPAGVVSPVVASLLQKSTTASVTPSQPMRSIDGFRPAQTFRAVPRPPAPLQKPPRAYPARASLDGIVVRRAQIT